MTTICAKIVRKSLVLPAAQPTVETAAESVAELAPTVQQEAAVNTIDENLIVLASSEGQCLV